MPLLYPQSGFTETIDAYLKQPARVSRDLLNLFESQRIGLVADEVFARGSSDQVAGGSSKYQYDFEGITLDRDPEEVSNRSDFPRAGVGAVEHRTEIVRQYGLEVEFNYLTLRRNAIDEFDRALLKLGNSIAKFIDQKMVNIFTGNADVLTMAGSGDWSLTSSNIARDIAVAQETLDLQEKGYVGDTLLAHTSHRTDIITNQTLANAIYGSANANPQLGAGEVRNFLGLRKMVFTPRLAAGTVYILNSGIVGTIADEVPTPEEGYSVDRRRDSRYGPVYVRVYENSNKTGKVLRGARWPAMWITDPKAAIKITGV